MSHQHNKPDNWAEVYYAQFGRQLSAAEISAWTSEVREAFEGKTKPWPGEAAKALRALGASWPTDDGKGGRNPYPPTCRDLISAMKAARRKAVDSVGAHTVVEQHTRILPNGSQCRYTTTVLDRTGDWQAELRNASAADRWAIICRPASNDQCRERELYCEHNRIPFDRFVPAGGYALAGIGAG